VRKYQLNDDTQRTSRSRVPTPDCNIALNWGVKGNGSFTGELSAIFPASDLTASKVSAADAQEILRLRYYFEIFIGDASRAGRAHANLRSDDRLPE
jgi:hypothetical protein